MDIQNQEVALTRDFDHVFILGTRPRSGTNFLRNLLIVHPAIGNGCVVWEDYLLLHAELLEKYALKTYNRWPSHWQVENKMGPYTTLCGFLGQGLTGFLNSCAVKNGLGHIGSHYKDPDETKTLVTKTPSVKHIGNFFKFIAQ